MFGRKKPPAGPPSNPSILHCSFCNKSQRDVQKLIAGPNVYICNECVDICLDIVAGSKKDEPAEEESAWPYSTISHCALCRLPLTLTEAVIVEDRGLICPGCLGEIEAAIAREKMPQ